MELVVKSYVGVVNDDCDVVIALVLVAVVSGAVVVDMASVLLDPIVVAEVELP